MKTFRVCFSIRNARGVWRVQAESAEAARALADARIQDDGDDFDDVEFEVDSLDEIRVESVKEDK